MVAWLLLVLHEAPLRAQPAAIPQIAKPLPQVTVSLDACGFIPFSQSYRLNYQSKLMGLPIEWTGTLGFPINESVSSQIELRYRRRTAVFLNDVSVRQLEITPGVKVYLEKQHEKDLRLFGTFGLLLAESIVSGPLQSTTDGTDIITVDVSKSYYNLGLAIGLGLEYELTPESTIHGGLRFGIYLLDPVSRGGLGDAGGISLGLGYQYSVF